MKNDIFRVFPLCVSEEFSFEESKDTSNVKIESVEIVHEPKSGIVFCIVKTDSTPPLLTSVERSSCFQVGQRASVNYYCDDEDDIGILLYYSIIGEAK